MAESIAQRTQEGRGVHCLSCDDTHWTPYYSETLEGTQEEALKLCADCTAIPSTCTDCQGYGHTISYPHLAHCFTCEGTGKILLVVNEQKAGRS